MPHDETKVDHDVRTDEFWLFDIRMGCVSASIRSLEIAEFNGVIIDMLPWSSTAWSCLFPVMIVLCNRKGFW